MKLEWMGEYRDVVEALIRYCNVYAHVYNREKLHHEGVTYSYSQIQVLEYLLENEEKPGWLYMPKIGATTIWEDWNGPTSGNGLGGGIASLNHYSKGAVCEWIFSEMCGIKVDGENHFCIAPKPGGHFTRASFSYDSIYGTVSCAWSLQEDGRYKIDTVVPPNTTADIILPEEAEKV